MRSTLPLHQLLRKQFMQPRANRHTKRILAHNTTVFRAMSSSTQPTASAPDTSSNATFPQATLSDLRQPEQDNKQPLSLPEPSSESTKLNINGEGVKLDHLGPLVVNKDGTLSRISNWANMAEIERQNTLRILGKRNQLRLVGLKSQEGGEK